MATLDDVLVGVEVVYKVADKALAEHRPEWIPCVRGCSWCCYQNNSLVSWVEAYKFMHVVKDWSEGEKKSLRTRAEDEVAMLMDDPEVAQFQDTEIPSDALCSLNAALREHIRPCVFLRDGECMIYTVRPMACRCFGQTAAQTVRGEESEITGNFCSVVMDIWDSLETAEKQVFLDATSFFKAIRHIAGAPTVFALPTCFWITAAAEGGDSWSLDKPEGMFERFLPFFRSVVIQTSRQAEGLTE